MCHCSISSVRNLTIRFKPFAEIQRAGSTDFGPLTLRTRPPIFIPRSETAFVIERLASTISSLPISAFTGERQIKILDIACGSGSLALLLAHLLPHAQVTGIDLNPDAVALAKENAALNNLQERVSFLEQDIWSLPGNLEAFDLVVSNPPYIPLEECQELPISVKDHEDPRALIGDPQDVSPCNTSSAEGGQGLSFYRQIARCLPHLLLQLNGKSRAESSIVAVEIGANQGPSVQDILLKQAGGLVDTTEIWKDQFGRDRMVVGWRTDG